MCETITPGYICVSLSPSVLRDGDVDAALTPVTAPQAAAADAALTPTPVHPPPIQRSPRRSRSRRTERSRGTLLPVDGYWPDLQLVVEFQEEQHSAPSPFFDRRQTVSGMGRGEQRRRYDQHKRALIPGHGLRLVVIERSQFTLKSRKIDRDRARDLEIVRRHLA